MTGKKTAFFFLLPVLLSFLLHFYVFKLDLSGFHLWRQAQTQTVIYNFSFSDNCIFHPQKFDLTNGTTALMYEFPLYQWLVSQVNNLFGYSVAHSRFASFFIFIFILLGFYKLLKGFVPAEIALLTNMLLCFSPMLYYYNVCPLPDLLALCFATWGLYFFFKFLPGQKWIPFLMYAFFLTLAALIKLPYILFGGLFAFYAYRSLREKRAQGLIIRTLIFFVFLIPVFVWYMRAIPTWGNNPVTKGILGNDKTLLHLLDCFQFNLLSTVPEVIANYAACLFLVLGIYLFFKNRKWQEERQQYLIVLFALFSGYFLFELNAIEKVHDYYLMPFVPLIFLVVANGLRTLYSGKYKWLVFVLVLVAPLTAWLRMDHRWSEPPIGAIKDYITGQNIFSEILPENAICVIDHDESKFIALYYLKREGYSLHKNELSPETLHSLFQKGVRYLVSENKSFDPGNYAQFYFEELFNRDLKIFKIKLK